MTKPLNCTMCGLAVWNESPTVWSDGVNREPYCDAECLRLASAVDNALPAAVDRAINRDHSLCGVDPCSDCR